MMPFDRLFREVAERDVRVIEVTDRAGDVATFVFREFYCAAPRCDCRRVLFHVHWMEDRRVAASINYAFDRPSRRGEPQIFLDRQHPQSENANELLALFRDMIAEDRAYRERLKRHYAMWKQVVDDPSHPDHAKLGAKPPRARKSNQRKARASDGLALVAAKAARADGKLQQRFRRLLAKVDGLRERVRVWKARRPQIECEAAANAARFEKQCSLGRDLVRVLDEAYDNAIFSKADRKKIAALICEIAGELLEHGGDDEIKATYQRHSGRDFDVEEAAADAANAAALKSMMEMFGIELGDAEVGSMDELREVAEARMRAADEEAEARRAKRKKSARQLAAEARRAAEERDATKAVQEVYRALAKALHPDREPDPAERARKTALMSEVNVAYEAKDLLRLLELQLELERVEPERVDAIADDRLRHYNKILDEQSRQLAGELAGFELPFRLEMEWAAAEPLSPDDVLARVREDAAGLDDQIAVRKNILASFRDVTRLKPWLRSWRRARADARY